MRVLVKGEPKRVKEFNNLLMDQDANFKLFNYHSTKIKFNEQSDEVLDFSILEGIKAFELSSLRSGDLRLKTKESENSPIIEFEKLIKELYLHKIFYAIKSNPFLTY